MDEPAEHNRRAWDSKIRLAVSVTILVSSLWGGVVFLSDNLVTQNDLIKQRYYTDYHVARLRLDFVTRAIERIESEMSAGELIKAQDRRVYDGLVKEQTELKKEVDRLAQTF